MTASRFQRNEQTTYFFNLHAYYFPHFENKYWIAKIPRLDATKVCTVTANYQEIHKLEPPAELDAKLISASEI